ncbi:hypothetical protein [Flavobacterium sp.]|uniref:hypothetical protein n=1 Tax=Flavobacterium sp. TaxID=239 RepID=UPI0031D7EC5C
MYKFQFTSFDNKDYLKISTTSNVKSLINKVRRESSSSPFINFDISDLILEHLPYLKIKVEDEALKEIITEATMYFRKGNTEEIFNIIKDKIEKRN